VVEYLFVEVAIYSLICWLTQEQLRQQAAIGLNNTQLQQIQEDIRIVKRKDQAELKRAEFAKSADKKKYLLRK